VMLMAPPLPAVAAPEPIETERVVRSWSCRS